MDFTFLLRKIKLIPSPWLCYPNSNRQGHKKVLKPFMIFLPLCFQYLHAAMRLKCTNRLPGDVEALLLAAPTHRPARLVVVHHHTPGGETFKL